MNSKEGECPRKQRGVVLKPLKNSPKINLFLTVFVVKDIYVFPNSASAIILKAVENAFRGARGLEESYFSRYLYFF